MRCAATDVHVPPHFPDALVPPPLPRIVPVVETSRKLVLTGFAVFFAQGAFLQLIVNLGVTMVFGMWLAKVKPYKIATDQQYGQLESVMLLLFMFAALLLEVDKNMTQMENMAGKSGFKMKMQGYSSTALAYCLVGLVVTVLGR